MDSILVEHALQGGRQPVYGPPRGEVRGGPPPALLLGGGVPVKRPTFDQLDKRASWSAERSVGPPPGTAPAPQFTPAHKL